jgi:uncharacterized protein (UPF0261 family)
MAGKIAIIATLDTKGEEADYLRQLILKRGHRPVVIDIGMGRQPLIPADISADEIALCGGAEIDKLRASSERRKITQTMTNGAIVKVKELYEAGGLDGIIAIGGASGSLVATAIMRALPFGVPKFMVSSAVSMPAMCGGFFGSGDITIMHSVVDIEGLNRFVANTLSRAVGAICGMVETKAPSLTPDKERPFVAITGYGYTEKCAHYVRQAVEEKGYEAIRFHATGAPETAMEELVDQGLFAAVIDLVPSSITHAMFGGTRIAGPQRLEVAGRKGIPQVVAPGGVNTFARTMDELTPELKARKHYIMDERRVTIRLSAEEMARIALVYADKLNKAVGPAKFLVPLRGWTSVDREGAPLYEPEMDMVFVSELRKRLKPEIEIREIDANIEDPAFAQAVVAAFEEVMRMKEASKT